MSKRIYKHIQYFCTGFFGMLIGMCLNIFITKYFLNQSFKMNDYVQITDPFFEKCVGPIRMKDLVRNVYVVEVYCPHPEQGVVTGMIEVPTSMVRKVDLSDEEENSSY